MKTFTCLFGLLCWMQSSLFAQSGLDIGIYNFPVNSTQLEVRIRPTQTITGGVYSAGIFTVRVPASSGVSITAPPALNTPLYGYTLQNQGTDGTYNYYIFAFVSIYPVNWTAGTAYPIAILQFNSSCGGIANFEIINNAWTAQYNGNYYQELNSLEAQNIIWQPTATAPLSSGPPNISCGGNKNVSTNNNLCSYIHSGTDWNATGSAACPGSMINYALSGATTGNFGSLAGAAFNKGLTTVTATITDNSNQTASCAFTVTVADGQNPTITAPAPVLAVANTAGCAATGLALGMPGVADNCSGIAITNNAPATFPPGATVVIWTATDAAGLTATATQLVTVQTNLTAGVQLAAPQICTGTATSLSFTVAGGAGPYSILYNNGGGNMTLNNYTSNQPVTVSPATTTTYQLVQVTDAGGCSISPGLTATLTVQPDPIIAHLLPPVVSVCAGAPVSFFADGLLPNASTTFTYTVNGQPTTATATTSAGGNFTFPPVAYPAGINNIVLTSVTVNGCTTSSSLGTSFEINAPSAACNLSVAGKALTETMIGLEGVYVDISGTGPGIAPYALSNLTTGLYSFLNVIPPTSNLIITPSKNDNPLNGVSTYDLVLISRHILGLDTLGSLYKMIAADATHSGSITTFDIVELRKLILGIYQVLPNNPSWRFLDASFVFPNPSNPFTVMLPETRTIQNMLTDHLQEDFIAVKIGDVNGSAIANATSPAEERTTGSLVFAAADQFFAAHEIFTVRFQAREKVQGYQFTMHLADLEIVHILPGPGMQLHHFGVFDDALTTSFDGDQPGEFEVTFRARTAGQLSAKIGVSSRITPAEAYSATKEKLAVELHFPGSDPKTAGARFEVYQNQPNPFTDKTQIGFYLPEATKTTLRIFDEMGRLVARQSADLEKGYNAFDVSGSLLDVSGTYYYQIETATDAACRKMVRLR